MQTRRSPRANNTAQPRKWWCMQRPIRPIVPVFLRTSVVVQMAGKKGPVLVAVPRTPDIFPIVNTALCIQGQRHPDLPQEADWITDSG